MDLNKANQSLAEAKESIISDYNKGGVKALVRNRFALFIAGSICVLLLLFLMIGGGGTPKGTDSNVKSLVLEISEQEIRRQVAPILYQQVTNVPAGLIGLEITYEYLVDNIDEEKNAEVVEAIDETMSNMSLALENIRINKIDEETKKSESSADLIVNGESNPIRYTAQRNSEGDIYVEVFGL